jgi:hypothetical protein
MTIHQRLLPCIAGLVWSAQALAHEFWIEPSAHRANPGDAVQILLKVGENFRGSAQPYLPNDFVRFEHVSVNGTVPITGLLGDSRPAATINIAPGLNQIIHHTVPFDIVFAEGDARWADYIALDGLAEQIAAHPEQPQVTPVSERYVRSVKSLIVAGPMAPADRLTGRLPYELVLEGSLTPGAQTFRLYSGDAHQSGILIKAFRHSDRAVVDQAITDRQGQVTLNLPTADRYLISGVVIAPDTHPDFDWLSHWPALTLEISD